MRQTAREERGRLPRLYIIAGILVVVWLVGLLTSNTMGGVVHVFLVMAIVAFFLRAMRGHNVFGTGH